MAHATGSKGVSRIRARSRSGHTRARAVLLAGMLSTTVLTGVAWLGVGSSSAAGTKAVAARTISLNETGNLHSTSGRITIDQVLNEQGTASGTIKGTIYIHLKLVSPTRVTAEVNIYPRGSSLTGSATATYHVDGGTANFSGTMSIDRGSGSYAHAHGSGLKFFGTVQRLYDAVTVHLSGSMST
jgi:hypothetical protein